MLKRTESIIVPGASRFLRWGFGSRGEVGGIALGGVVAPPHAQNMHFIADNYVDRYRCLNAATVINDLSGPMT